MEHLAFSKKDKQLIARANGQETLFGEIRCNGPCGRSFPLDIMQVDYKRPISKKGKPNPSNLQLLCPTCNRKKSNKIVKANKPKNMWDVDFHI